METKNLVEDQKIILLHWLWSRGKHADINLAIMDKRMGTPDLNRK